MPVHTHRWDLSPKEAIKLQKELAGQVILKQQMGSVKTVAGVDVGIRNGMARAAAVVLDFPGLKVLDYAIAVHPVAFPYIPGLLSFREGPVILEAVRKLAVQPDLIIFDGQGRAHPRRLGIASHIGLLLDLPAIGCAKSRLCGKHDLPDYHRGSHVPLLDKGEIIGAVLRTRSGVKPVFVSIGHRVDLTASIKYVLACCQKFRLPETTRQAHRLATEGKILTLA